MGLSALHATTETLAWTLLHFLWQGVLIGALYALARQVSDNARWRHAVALVALLAVLAIPALTFAWLDRAVDAPVVAAAASVAQTDPMVAPPSTEPASSFAATVGADFVGEGFWSAALVVLWLLGALVIATRLFGDWRLIRRAIRHGVEPPGELAALFERQLQRVGLRRTVRLRLTARITVPGVYGILRPIILLPTALALSLPREQLEALLIHELAHIRRADVIVNTLALAARTLLYFHPVVHWICRDLERTRETLCDDLVIGLEVDRIGYARALSTAEQFRQQVPVPLLTATGGELTQRVHRILALAPDASRRRDRAPLLAALAVIATTLAALSGHRTEELLALTRPDFRVVLQTALAAPAPLAPAPVTGARPILPTLPALVATPIDVAADVVEEPDAGRPLAAVSASPDPGLIVPAPAVDAPAAFEPGDFARNPPPASVGLTAAETPPPVALPTRASDQAERRAGVSEPATVPAATAAPRVTRRVQPDYPRAASWQGIEGSVTVRYTVDDNGRPADISIVSAEPAGIFEAATLEAFDRWRFDTAGDTDASFVQTFDFTLSRGEGEERCALRVGSKICRR